MVEITDIAGIQGRLLPDRSPPGDSMMSDMSYALVARRSQQQRINKGEPC